MPNCGDGFKVGNELCDAGLNLGCKADCTGIETGYSCDGATPDVCHLICGDGRVIPPEICDDGPQSHLAPFSVVSCLPDCSNSDPKWSCFGGNPIT